MKKLFLLGVLLGVINTSFAGSPINLGLKAGYSSSMLTTDLDQFNDGSVSNFLVGAFLRVNLKKWYLQPEGYFTSKGGNLNDVTTESFDLNTVDVPLLLGYKLIDVAKVNVRLNAGPVFSFITKKDGDTSGSEFDYNNVKDNYVGIQYGAGVDFLFLTLDARMENSLGDVHTGGGDEKIKLFMVTLGIKFL
ncbi:porin family protein [Mangrovibacterium diazotrophicum]|uniref:Outer membrane protein with beta-barrel domain n=1 Tax=Mangrovibacterium diazotrophicum TaxID=1261403 RepID=A0A419W3S0_9BACT|nr:porin family protein [Mangrovibacterium diazotrophicum]RKD90089.1 outer membrane protein with beta-barrel domain [Mangrovibacterium diazotrophicum]